MVVTHNRPFNAELGKGWDKSFGETELCREEALRRSELVRTEEVITLQGYVLINKVLEEISRTDKRSH